MGQAGAGDEWMRVVQCDIVLSQTVERAEDGHDGSKMEQVELVLPGFEGFIRLLST